MIHNKDDFVTFLKQRKSSVYLFLDIETCTINKKAGRIKPTSYHSFSFSVAVSYFLNLDFPNVTIFNDFPTFFETIIENGNKKTTYNLVIHNGNKFDNHFLVSEMCQEFSEIKRDNMYIRNAIQNKNTILISDLTKEEKEKGIFLEKRVKVSTNLDYEFFWKGFHFKNIDNWVKTNASIRTIGKKLKDNGFLSEKYLKTDFQYDKYDLDEDLSYLQIKEYRKIIFQKLSENELIYIKNDVIILAMCYKYYQQLFFGFDYNAFTFTSNIKEEYLINRTASFQLLKKVGKLSLNYNDYDFHNLNLFNYFNNFYKGGLNFYNDKYVGKNLKKGFSIDINSSYPYSMFHFKIPTYLHDFKDYKKATFTSIETNNENKMTFFTMKIEDANNEIISKIPSKIFKQMIVKYYSSKKGEIYINNYLIKLINEVFHLSISSLTITSYVIFDCVDFGAKDVIASNYFIKTQGKQIKKINMLSPENIMLLSEKNDKIFSKEEVAGSKVLLNGIYGIPALRAYFDLFRFVNNKLVNVQNGFKNQERNVLFSASITAFSFYHLLSPLKYVPNDKIDEYFWYCDTDSLYLDKRAYNYLPENMFHKMNLGKWDIEHENIEKFYILNHKKYAYFSENKIHIRCGGVRLENFNRNMPFEQFISTQFSENISVKNTRSILNEQNTITIYNSYTKLQKGSSYPIEYSQELDEDRESIIKDLHEKFSKEEEQQNTHELLYIESEIGTFSIRDTIPDEPLTNNSMKLFQKESNRFRKLIEKK